MTRNRDLQSSPYMEQQPAYAPGESPVEQLLARFEYHEQQERDFVGTYRELAARSANPSIKFLLDLIVSDEEKHHVVTRAMASALRHDVHWSHAPQPLAGISDVPKEKAELLQITEDFIRLEQEGIDDYEKLSRESKGYYGGLFVLLLSTMIRDSEKHLEILRFLRRTLKAG